MAKKVYKQNPARYRMEDQLVVGTPFASHDAIVNSQPVGTPYTPGSPTAAGLYNVTFKNTQPLNKNQRTTSPWYSYMDLGVDVFDRREFDNIKNRNVVPSFEPWKRQIQPNLTLGIEHTNKFNPRVDPYKRLTTKNSSMGAGLTVGAYEGGSGLSVFAKPEIDYRIPFSHSGSSSGSSSREKLYGPLGRYEDKKRISIPSPVGMDIYGNLDAAYLVPANWTNDDSIYRQLRVSSQTPNNFNMGRNRVGANIGARAQWKDNTSANLNVGAYYNPYNPGSKIVPRVELGVSHRFKDGGTWLNQYGSGTSNVQPTLTFNTRPVGAVNVGTAADNTSVVVNTPRGPVVTGYRKDATPDPTITKKVQDAQAVSRPAAAEATTSEASLLNPIIAIGEGLLKANEYLGRSMDESLPIALSRRYADKLLNVPEKNRNRAGISIYDNNETFKDAWEDARKKGQAIFWWKNPKTGEYEKKSTKSELSEENQLDKYGITDSQIKWNHNNRIKRHFGIDMANNFYPFNYGDHPISKVWKGIVLGQKVLNADYPFNTMSNEQVQYYIDKDEKETPIMRRRQDAIRMYVGSPQKNDTFSISQYKDPKYESTASGQTYYSINLTPKEKTDYVNKFYNSFEVDPTTGKSVKKNYKLNEEIPLEDELGIMGNYRSIKNKDDKGEYIDYYDRWDLDPLDFEKKLGVIPPQPGNPYNIYDRIYVKDYGTDGNHWYKPVFYNDDELKNLDINKAKQEELVAELENRGYKIKDPNDTKEINKALIEFQSKKRLGGWLNNYK